MLEIVILVFLCRKLAAIAGGKGRSGWWAALGVVFWFGGELLGAMVVVIGAGEDTPLAYLGALIFAGLGAGAAWLAVKSLPAGALAAGRAY